MTTNSTLIPTLAYAAVGHPITRCGASLIPVYLHAASIDIATGPDCGVTVGEQQSAEVPTLLANNPGDRVVLLVDGQIVEGGLQTRILNVSVLVGAHQQLSIPVSCVEHGRWSGGGSFIQGGSFATRRVRRAKSETLGDSVRSRGTKHSDQGTVWNSVASELSRLNVRSDSGSLSAAEGRLHGDDRIATAVDELCRLGPLPGQCGVIVAHGSRIVSLELFATPTMLGTHWGALVAGMMLDAPAAEPTIRPSLTRALRFVDWVANGQATVTDGVGLGREHHVRTTRLVAQALVYENVLVHLSAFALAA